MKIRVDFSHSYDKTR